MVTQKRKKKTRRRFSSRTWKWALFCILSVGLAVVIFFGYRFLGPNTKPFSDHKYFYIKTGSSYRQVIDALKTQGIVKNIHSLEWVAERLHYPQHVHAGKYKITPGMNNLALIRLLRSGKQTPVRLILNKLRTKGDLAGFVSQQLEPDSLTLMELLDDNTYLRQFGLDTNTAMCAIIPNTYEFFWNTSAESFFARMVKEKDQFWTDKRKTEASTIGLTPQQVYIMASIVEEETNKSTDKPLIASVYLNRLRTGMRLAADPTARFAAGDFTLRRITGKQTLIASPYNTYRQPGLPPGPICTPSIRTIDAVLAAPHTDYLYFCAKADFSGYNVYATTYREHLRNARAYQRALDSLHIN